MPRSRLISKFLNARNDHDRKAYNMQKNTFLVS